MKKIVVSFAVAATAFTARPDLVNGNFTFKEAGKTASLRSFAAIGKGWYIYDPPGRYFEFINGGATLNNMGASSKPVLTGQLFTYSETGDRALNFDVSVVDSNANLDFRVQLYGYRQLTKEKTILFANAIKLENAEPPVNSDYYTVTELVNYAHIPTGTISNGQFAAQSVTFPASADYAFYGIRIIANRPDVDDRITFDNVSIKAVPEPTMSGL